SDERWLREYASAENIASAYLNDHSMRVPQVSPAEPPGQRPVIATAPGLAATAPRPAAEPPHLSHTPYMRSIWKGEVSFGLVNVPVKVYAATEDHDLHA